MSSIARKFQDLTVSHHKLYWGLVLAFVLKAVGASWDASYHFKHFREFYQLPHIINALGGLLLLAIMAYLWTKEVKRTHPQLKIITAGILIFFIAIFFDQWSHEKYGIDLTAWSPSHFMLYLGTMIALIGSLFYIFRDSEHSRISLKAKKVLGLVFSYLILDGFWFPLIQHEQGVLTDYALKHGVRLADPELLELFFRTQHDVYSNLPEWLYGAWAVFCCVLVFQFVKRMDLHKYAATIVAGMYVLERLVMNTLFSFMNYPLSVLPFFLIAIAFLFDVLYNKFENQSVLKNLSTSMVVIIGVLVLGIFNPETPIHPPIPILSTFLFAIPAAVVGCVLGILLYKWFVKQNK